MVNQCTFIGNLGADPEIRTTQQGKKIANFRVAVSKKWKDKNTGEHREKTEWIPIVIFSEGLTRIVEKYLKKGSKVFIQGEYTTRKWQDQSGNDRYSTEVTLQGFNGTLTMLDGKSGGNQSGQQSGHSDGYNAGGSPNSGADMDAEIPFMAEYR